MKKVITTFVTIFLTMAATPHWANAAIITFDEVNIDPFARTYSENGILATGSDGISPTSGALGRYGYQSVHLDDGGTDAPGKVTFTTGSYFDAVGFDLDPVEFSKGLCDRTIEEFPQIICIESFDNVLVKGFDGANLVASFLFNMGLGVPSRMIT